MPNPTEPDALRAQFRAFIHQNFYIADPSTFDDRTSFIDRGIIDSTGVLELVGFVENELGVKVADEDMVPSNFDSIDALCAYVAARRS